jgi:hypothetical protein
LLMHPLVQVSSHAVSVLNSLNDATQHALPVVQK